MENWKQAELFCTDILEDVYTRTAHTVSELEKQYQDIDVVDDHNCSYSVKEQSSCMKYGNFVFETALMNRATGQEGLGSFLKCKADAYMIMFSSDNKHYALGFRTCQLKDFILNNKNRWRECTTRIATEQQDNKGRKLNAASLLLVPVKCLLKIAQGFQLVNDKWQATNTISNLF